MSEVSEMVARIGVDVQPLRVGPAQANEPQFRAAGHRGSTMVFRRPSGDLLGELQERLKKLEGIEAFARMVADEARQAVERGQDDYFTAERVVRWAKDAGIGAVGGQ